MSDSDEFSDAHSSNNNFESFKPPSQLFITSNASDIFSIEGPATSVGSREDSGEEDDDDFFDVIEQPEGPNDSERKDFEVNNRRLTGNSSRRNRQDLTILEFLQEEPEEAKSEAEAEAEKEERANAEKSNRRETIYEFLAEDNSNSGSAEADKSESSLSRLQAELDTEKPALEQDDDTVRRSILNLPRKPQQDRPLPPLPLRRRESLLKRANPLASFFVNDEGDPEGSGSDSDSMISELTETLTARTDLSETRLSRVPSSLLSQSDDYIKLAKRYKPVTVKVKSKQKAEFNSLFLIQELNRSSSSGSSNRRSTTLTVPEGNEPTAPDPSKAIFVLKFSPDGHFLAAAGAEGLIKIWSLLRVDPESTTNPPRLAAIFETEPIQILAGHTAEILDCAWSTNNFLLSASMDKTVRLWHHSRPDALGIFQHLDYVTSVAFHPRDPRIFLSGSLDCKLRLWSIQDRTILHWNELPPGNYITAVAFTRTGTTAIAGTSGGTALIFDTDRLRYNTQILVRSSRSKSVGKKITSIESVPGNFEDERIVISSNDSRIRMYSLRDKNVLYKYKGHINISSQISASLSTDADYLLSGSEDCRVYLWRMDGKFQKKSFLDSFRKDHVKSYESFKAHSNPVTAAIIAPNCVTNLLQSLQIRPINPLLQSTEGKIIVTADVTGQIKVFENSSKLVEWLK